MKVMEDKQLTTEESLDIIARIIASTRQNFNNAGGAMFLLWGYTTIAVTLAVYIAFSITKSYYIMWLWWALPLIGGVLTWLHYRKYKKPVQTHLDRAVNYVWIAFAAATGVCMVFGFIPASVLRGAGVQMAFPIILIMSLMISLSTAITGLLIKFRPAAVSGFVGMPLAMLAWIFSTTMDQLLVFAGLMLIVQVIPGHLLNAACKREVRESAEMAKNGRAE